MTADLLSASVRAGHLEGLAFWDADLQTYAVDLAVFAEGACYPPPVVRYGRRRGEFLTVDALDNALAAAGLDVGASSQDELQRLARDVEGRWGHTEIVGLAVGSGLGRLCLRRPDRTVVELRPRLDDPGQGFHWGRGRSADLTAAAVVESAFGRPAPRDAATFELTLAVEYLDHVTGDFSINAHSLCDWFLADAPLVTTVDEIERRWIRRRLGLDPGVVGRRGAFAA